MLWCVVYSGHIYGGVSGCGDISGSSGGSGIGSSDVVAIVMVGSSCVGVVVVWSFTAYSSPLRRRAGPFPSLREPELFRCRVCNGSS